MNAVAVLQFAPTLMLAFMRDDPRLLLVNAVAWLDPNQLIKPPVDLHDVEFDDEAEDPFTTALYICRQCFPLVYAGAIQLQWQGADDQQLERYLLEGVSANLVVGPDALEELNYGPPLDFCGLAFYTVEDCDAASPPYNRLLPIYAMFGWSADGEVTDAALATARALIQSLAERTEPLYRDLTHLLMWLFSLSGNTAVDYTSDEFWENGFDPPQWTEDDIALINDINQEAREIITSALSAVQAFEDDSGFRKMFQRNVRAVMRSAQEQNQKKGNATHARSSPRRDTDPATLARYARWPERP